MKDLIRKTSETLLLSCEKKQIPPQSRDLFLNPIKFYYRSVVRNRRKTEIRSAKSQKSLAVALSRSEIETILQSPKNIKHKLLLALAHGSGLRVSEVIALKVQDIDLEEVTLHIKQAKSQKDRISVLPESLVSDLQNLITGKAKNDFKFFTCGSQQAKS